MSREERRWATVVFADLSGFTSLSERTDPEDVRALVDRCAAHMTAIVEDHGGWFDKLIGDSVLAVFGADVAHGDDAERAVRAALELRDCAARYPDDFGGLRLSIGVNTGEVMFAAVGPAVRRDLTVMGDTVNTAARLQSAAAPGAVLVGEETWRATRSIVRYEELPAIEAKGKERPLRSWRALDAVALGADRPVSQVPLIGRDHERSALVSVWERTLVERRPHLATVIGPAGIGKTKLVHEVVEAIRASGGRVARGRSLPYGESTGYGAFSQAVKQAVGMLDTDDAEAARAALRDHVARLLPAEEVDEVTENVATLVGVGGASGADRAALFFSARRFVEALAREAPLALVFEDSHWAEATLLELVEALATRCRDASVLFMTTARPELLDTAPRWGGGVGAATTITLEPLSEEAARQLAARHLGVEDDSATAARLATASDGNPLFIEELSASVVERSTDATDELPTNVRLIIAARIDKLPARERAVLLDASVVGKEFWQGALERLGHRGVEQTLDALDRRDLVRREPASRFEGESEYTFRHILIRDVAYATLSRAARRERHATVAAFLEAAAGGRSAEFASVLAHHWREAGDVERAIDYLIAAAERASRAWAAAEARQLYGEALELLPDGAEQRRRDILLARGVLLADAAFYADAVADLDAVLPFLEGRQRAEALLTRGNAAAWLMDGHVARTCGEEALQLVASSELRGPVLSLIAFAGSIDGRIDAMLDVQREALAAWQPGTRPRDLADHLSRMSLGLYWVGDHAEAVDRARESYALATEHQAVGALLQSGSHLALALAGNGRHDEALEIFEKVVLQGRELEAIPRLTSRTLNMMASALRETGEESEAVLRNEEAIEYARAADFEAARVQGGIDLVFAAVAAGELGDARTRWGRVRDDVERLAGWHRWLALGRLALAAAEIELGNGDPAACATAAADAVRQAEAVRRRKYEALGRAVLGLALVDLDRAEEGTAECERASTLAKAVGHPPTIWRVDAARARTMAAAGREAEAARVADDTRRRVASFAESLSPLRRETFLSAQWTTALLGSLPG